MQLRILSVKLQGVKLNYNLVDLIKEFKEPTKSGGNNIIPDQDFLFQSVDVRFHSSDFGTTPALGQGSKFMKKNKQLEEY